MRLNQPMNRVSQRRGMRLVSRKLMFSCCTTRPIRERAVILMSFACNTVRAEDLRDQTDTWLSAGCLRTGGRAAQGATAAAAFAGEAPLADRALAHGTALRRAGAVLRIRRGRAFSAPTRRPSIVAATRREGFLRLAASLAARSQEPWNRPTWSWTAFPICNSPPATACLSSSAASCATTSRRLPSSSPPPASPLTDLDGNRFYDLTGSYGVNVFGYDFYKECIARGSERVRDLGPVLGFYHPVTAYNVRRLLEISGMEEVSFHMSGTEAVMQAVRLARYHTRRTSPRALLRRLSRLVGRCAARRRQSAGGTRDLYVEGHGRGGPAGARIAARHCLRAGQPAAGACIRMSARPRTRRCSTAAAARTSTAPPTANGCRNCARCAANAGSY